VPADDGKWRQLKPLIRADFRTFSLVADAADSLCQGEGRGSDRHRRQPVNFAGSGTRLPNGDEQIDLTGVFFGAGSEAVDPANGVQPDSVREFGEVAMRGPTYKRSTARSDEAWPFRGRRWTSSSKPRGGSCPTSKASTSSTPTTPSPTSGTG
jgi:hypothetical protein